MIVQAIWTFDVDHSDFMPKYVKVNELCKELTATELDYMIKRDQLSKDDFEYVVRPDLPSNYKSKFLTKGNKYIWISNRNISYMEAKAGYQITNNIDMHIISNDTDINDIINYCSNAECAGFFIDPLSLSTATILELAFIKPESYIFCYGSNGCYTEDVKSWLLSRI